MSRITDYVLEKEQEGELIYDDYSGVYMSPYRKTLADEIEYLEWQISSLKKDLQRKVREINKYSNGGTT